MKAPIYCILFPLLFIFFPNPLPSSSLPPTSTVTVLFVILLLPLNGWFSHIRCVIFLNDIMDLLVKIWYLSTRRALPYKCILRPPVMGSQQLSVLYWMNNSLISKNSFPKCLFKNYSLVEVTYLLIGCSKTRVFLLNTNNTNRNYGNKQSTNTLNFQRKILERVSLKISDIPHFLKGLPPSFPNPLYGGREIPLMWR